MKIVHICLGCFYIDNYSYQENLLPKYHKKMGHDVTIIASLLSFDKNGNSCCLERESTYINEHGCQVIRVDYRSTFKNVTKFLRIFNNTYKLIEEQKPDILFIHGCQFWDIHNIIKYLKKKNSVKVYVDNHADFSNSATNWISKNILHKIIWRYCAKKIEPYTEKIYGVLPARTEFLISMYKMPKNKVEFLPMGADDEKIDWGNRENIRKKIRKEFNIHEDDFLILTGGKIDLSKTQILLLMQAVKFMPERVKLIVFGNVVEELYKEFHELCDMNKIIFAGWINSDEIYNYFHACELCVFPGRHSVIWEQAVGTGIPCIFKYWEGTDHLDLGGNCKFLYNDSIEEIHDTILEIINDKSLYNEMKDICIKKGIPFFSYQSIAKRSISTNI